MIQKIQSFFKSLLKVITGRLFIISFLIAVQIAVFVVMILLLERFLLYFDLFCSLLSLVICIYIIIKNDNPAYKLAWIIPVLILPIFGVFFYLIFGKHNIAPKMKKTIQRTYEESRKNLPENKELLQEVEEQSQTVAKQSRYITSVSNYPIWKNTETEYLSPGERKFERLIEELKKAEKFIFLEYFIVEEGVMWDTILEILIEKAKSGVEVKFMYDDLGTIRLLPYKYHLKLQEHGIQTAVFNPFRPSLDTFMNYRDHRKIAVIDGNVGITGGINLADEYINVYEKHGHWKDASVLIRGDAVWNLTVMFLDLWQYATNDTQKIDYNRYRPSISPKSKGYVQPYSDSPIDSYLVGEMVYANIINNAKRYIYICTPYLILDNEMITMLKLASESGIDVKIITPGVADKAYVHAVTRSNYQTLIQSGVRIYEYTPGFMHSKLMICDDKIGVIGTTNFDFRSFYLHFECGVYMYECNAILQALDDFNRTLRVSREITLEDCKNVNIFVRLARSILKLFSPLM